MDASTPPVVETPRTWIGPVPAAGGGSGSGAFGYTASGPIVGGDIQLLETVAPVG